MLAKEGIDQSKITDASERLLTWLTARIPTMEVIEKLIKLAKEVQESGHRAGLTPDEWAFYDALAANSNAKQSWVTISSK